jgi:hypothetical protein
VEAEIDSQVLPCTISWMENASSSDDRVETTPVSLPPEWNEYEYPTRFVLLHVENLTKYFTLFTGLDPYIILRPVPSQCCSVRTRYVEDLPWTKWLGANPLLEVDRDQTVHLLLPLEKRDIEIQVECHNSGYLTDGLIGQTTLNLAKIPTKCGEVVQVPLEPEGELTLRIALVELTLNTPVPRPMLLPSTEPARLGCIIEVHAGKSLRNQQIFFAQDPYLLATSLPTRLRQSTSEYVLNGGVEPLFNELTPLGFTFLFVTMEPGKKRFLLEVWNANWVTDQLITRLEIRLPGDTGDSSSKQGAQGGSSSNLSQGFAGGPNCGTSHPHTHYEEIDKVCTTNRSRTRTGLFAHTRSLLNGTH